MCPQCKGAGYYSLDVRVDHPDFGRLITCTCQCQQRRLAAEKSAALGDALGIFAGKTLADFDAERDVGKEPVTWHGKALGVAEQRMALRAARESVRGYLADGAPEWLYLCGPFGCGKSLLAAIVANALGGQGRSVLYRSTPQALELIKDGFRDSTSSERKRTLCGVDVLILDDIGTEHTTDWSEAQLFDIIEERSRFERTTVLTANILLRSLSPRVASRISGLARIVPIVAADYRPLLRQRRAAS